LNKITADKIFNDTYSVWVKAEMDQILKRVAKNKNRPLLACENPQDVLEKLMREREEIYQKAAFTLHSSDGYAGKALKALIAEIEATHAEENV
jgi:shikimate kinase